jgi:hypothetical protein
MILAFSREVSLQRKTEHHNDSSVQESGDHCALARTGTRSDCAVPDFFVTFFVRKKVNNNSSQRTLLSLVYNQQPSIISHIHYS